MPPPYNIVDGNWQDAEGVTVTDGILLRYLDELGARGATTASADEVLALARQASGGEVTRQVTLETMQQVTGITLPDSGSFLYTNALDGLLNAYSALQEFNAELTYINLEDGRTVAFRSGSDRPIFMKDAGKGYKLSPESALGGYILVGPNGGSPQFIPAPTPVRRGTPATSIPIDRTDFVLFRDTDGVGHILSKAEDEAIKLGETELGEVLKKDGFNFIELSPGEFKFLGPAGDVTIADDPITGMVRITQKDGSVQLVSKTVAASIVEDPISGRLKITQPDGSISFMDEVGTATVVLDPTTGRFKVTQPDGTISFLAPALQEATVTRDDVTGRIKITDTQGNIRLLSHEEEATITQDPTTGRFKVTQRDGSIQLLPETFDPGFLEGDQNLFQQRSGQVTQFAGPQLEDMITQALIDGEYEKAFAFQDFRDRPSAESELKLRLQFARSPADQQIISEIARGQTTVDQQPFDPLNPRRVGTQPDFLVDAYNDFVARTQMGRPPTQEEGATLLERLRTGRSPETDALQAEVDQLKQTIADNEVSFEQRLTDASLDSKSKEVDLEANMVQAGSSSGRESTDRVIRGGFGDPDFDFSTTLAGQHHARVQQGIRARELGIDPRTVDRETGQVDLGPLGFAGSSSELASLASPGVRETLGLDPLEDDFLAHGGIIDDGTAIVGEEGPELAILPIGTRVVDAKTTRRLTKGQAGRMRKKGVQSLQGGGMVFPNAVDQQPFDPLNPRRVGDQPDFLVEAYNDFIARGQTTSGLPFGLRQLQSGRAIEPTRARLLRAANLQLPSLQAQQNLTPESMEIFADLGAQAGIPRGALAQELESTIPGGVRLPIGRRRPLQLTGIR